MVTTAELDIRPDSLARGELRKVDSDLLHDLQKGSTDDVPILFDAATPPDRSLVLTMAAAVCAAFGWVVRPGESPPIDPLQITITRSLEQREEEPVADFFEPVSYNWNRHLYRASVAVREYSEHIDADY